MAPKRPPQPPTKRAGRKPVLPPGSSSKSVVLEPEVLAYLEDAAHAERIPASALIRRILGDWVRRHRSGKRSY